MESQFTHRPSPSMIVAMLALFISITGTAVGLPGKNSVNSGDVVNETLKSQDLRNDEAVASSDVIDDSLTSEDIANGTLETGDYGTASVTSGEIANGSLGAPDFGTDSVTSEAIAESAVGSSELAPNSVDSSQLQAGSVKAVEIAPGEVGGNHLAGTFAVLTGSTNLGSQTEGNNDYVFGEATSNCPSNSVVIGGGGTFGGDRGGVGGDELQALTESHRTQNGWTVVGVSDVDDDILRAEAYCLRPGGQ